MDSPLNILLKNVINYFVKTQSLDYHENYRKFSTLIRMHNERLLENGDVSFTGKPDIWVNYFCNSNGQLNEAAFEILNGKDGSKRAFLNEAKQWSFPVEKLEVRQHRIHLYLQRKTIMENLVKQALTDDSYGHLPKNGDKLIYLHNLLPEDDNENNLSIYRSKVMHNVLQNLLKYSRWKQIDKNQENIQKECLLEIRVKSVASTHSQIDGRIIKCGLVTDPSKKGKPCQLAFRDYLSIRSNDMTLIAFHKYGESVNQDDRFCSLMQRLGIAATTVDLLEVKHTSPVQVILNGQGSSKGASFILYNSARLETILRHFEEYVDAGYYDPIIPIDSVQWNVLSEEEEWQLVYAYIAGFPNLIDRCMERIESGLCSTHLIVQFLNGFVATFSIYYRRTKILTEKRDHLMPFIYARIYLLKAVREILNKTLALLNIEPAEFM